MGIPVEGLIVHVEEALGWPYVSPGSNDAAGIDCSGLLVYAFRQEGQSIYHGSNTIWRKYCTDKGKLTSEAQLKPGYAVFKWNPNTPEKFGDGLGDFQHVGVVTHVNPLRIVHASSVSGKVITDTKLGKWKYWGALKGVDYDGGTPGEVSRMEVYRVTAETGSTVNVREKPDLNGRKLGKVRIGDTVNAGLAENGWRPVEYLGRSGWMMAKYLQPVSAATQTDLQPAPAEPHPAGVPVTVTVGGVVMTFGYDDAVGLREQLIRELGVG